VAQPRNRRSPWKPSSYLTVGRSHGYHLYTDVFSWRRGTAGNRLADLRVVARPLARTARRSSPLCVFVAFPNPEANRSRCPPCVRKIRTFTDTSPRVSANLNCCTVTAIAYGSAADARITARRSASFVCCSREQNAYYALAICRRSLRRRTNGTNRC
jgi:hypothetical protein